MEWSVQFDKRQNLLKISASGEPTLEGFKGYLETIASSPDWNPETTKIFCDFRDLQLSMITPEFMDQLIRLHAELFHGRIGNQTAIAVSHSADYGMVRRWEIYTNDFYPKQAIFYTPDDAINWLFGNNQGNSEP